MEIRTVAILGAGNGGLAAACDLARRGIEVRLHARREESLADLPLSVVAISAEAMRVQGIYNTRDIGEFAANVSLTFSDRMGHSRIFIRGIGGGFPNPIQVFGSGMYIDGHYLAVPGHLHEHGGRRAR